MKNYTLISTSFYPLISTTILIIIISLVAIGISYGQTNLPRKNVSVNGKKFVHIPRVAEANRMLCDREFNRSFDGTCNNVRTSFTMEWGAADIKVYRELASAYGAPDFNNDMAGNCRLSPRAISNLVIAQSGDMPSPRNLSSLVFTWGQFIDHDIDLSPEGETEYYPILLPADEPLFTQPIPFLRSEPYPGTGVDAPREQENIITSWMDASQVYGSEDTRAAWLRSFEKGKLKTSEGDLLPYNTVDGNLGSSIDPNAPSMAGDGGGLAKVFVAGDVRANEQPGLTAMHTLFVREHNRICDELWSPSSSNDEEVYQRARKIVGGIMQNITYRHFLPALGVDISNYNGYKSDVQPDISNVFSTAAYRIGHTMVTEEIPLIAPNCEPVGDGAIALLDGFFNPEILPLYGIEPILQGLAGQTQQKVDAKIVDNLRNFLFPVPGSNDLFGLDLASLNIQRGRDHGLPNYNAIRNYFLGAGVDDFSDITADPVAQAALEAAYGSVYDMDAWVGLLSEDPMPGSSVGPTMNAILSNQFEILRDGDYYYYQNDPILSNAEKDDIRRTSLDEVITRNSEINRMQNNVFFADDCDDNRPGGGGGGGGGGDPDRPGRPGNGTVVAPYTQPDGGSISSALGNATVNLYPNPANGKVQINFLLEEVVESVDLNIQDINGRQVYQEQRSSKDLVHFYDLNLSHLAPGMYLITLRAGDHIYAEKLIIEKE